jgi:hypothetical protein
MRAWNNYVRFGWDGSRPWCWARGMTLPAQGMPSCAMLQVPCALCALCSVLCARVTPNRCTGSLCNTYGVCTQYRYTSQRNLLLCTTYRSSEHWAVERAPPAGTRCRETGPAFVLGCRRTLAFLGRTHPVPPSVHWFIGPSAEASEAALSCGLAPSSIRPALCVRCEPRLDAWLPTAPVSRLPARPPLRGLTTS